MDRFPASQQPENRKRSDLDSPELLQELREKGPQGSSNNSLTRRNFFLGGGAALAAMTSGMKLGDSDFHRKANELKSSLEKLYGIRIVMGPPRGEDHIRGDMTKLETYASALTLISQELSMYPLDMIRKVTGKRPLEIRVVDKLTTTSATAFGVSALEADQPVSVGGLMEEQVNGKEESRITLNTSMRLDYQRRTIHHELNHQFSREWEERNQRDRKWARFNSTSVLNPYRPVPAGTYADTPTDDRRFLTLFAGSSAADDQAISAERMMTPRLHADFLDRIENEKDENIKATLVAKYNETIDTYKRWSGGKMDEAFWERIAEQGKKERQKLPKG
ncbi:MAG: hypothetical protein AAB790_02030 [Patescibacteria group bacterium]